MERVKRSFYWKCENVGRFILRSAWNVGTNLYIFCSATIRFSSGKEMPIIFPAPPTPKALRRLWRLLSKMNIWFFSCRTGSTQIPRMASYRQQLWLIQNLIKIFSFHYGRMKIHKIAIKGVLRSLSRGWAFCIVVSTEYRFFSAYLYSQAQALLQTFSMMSLKQFNRRSVPITPCPMIKSFHAEERWQISSCSGGIFIRYASFNPTYFGSQCVPLTSLQGFSR